MRAPQLHCCGHGSWRPTTTPAMMAYVTTETGVVTMIIMVLLAGYLLTTGRRLRQGRTKVPPADHKITHCCVTQVERIEGQGI